MARWEDNKFYAAQIYRVHPSGKKYDVYFPEDGETRCGLSPRDLKHPKPPLPNWAKVSRKQFIGESFMHDCVDDERAPKGEKKGQFKVMKMESDKVQENVYMCQRMYKNGRLAKKTVWFDMGYVQKRVLHQIFPFDKTFAR